MELPVKQLRWLAREGIFCSRTEASLSPDGVSPAQLQSAPAAHYRSPSAATGATVQSPESNGRNQSEISSPPFTLLTGRIPV